MTLLVFSILFNNNNNENFTCVFECTIVNLAMYRQFTDAAWDWMIKKKKQNKTKAKKKKKRKEIALSLGYPNCYFCNKRSNMLLWWLYHFLDYMKLLLFVNANVIYHVKERGAFIGENAKGTRGDIYKSHTSVISTHFIDQVKIFFFFNALHCC